MRSTAARAFEAGLACFVAAVWAAPVAWGAGTEARPAAGGVHLFPALERSPVSIVAILEAPRALDGESYAAALQVEVVLVGNVEQGARLSIAWEELARSRRVRFREGDRVLLCLEPLPGASIWRERLPEPEERLATLGIAERGDAFAIAPSLGAVQLIEHFMALPAELRDGSPGVAHLIRLAEMAEEVLAVAALERLAAVVSLDRVIGEVSAQRLVRTLLREPPRLGEMLLDVVERRRLESMRAPLSALASGDGTGPSRVYEAIARLDGELSAELARELLEREDSPAHRALGARYAPEALVARLPRLLRSDGSPQVRAAAVKRLVELRGAAEMDRVLYALDDGDESVRVQAMLSVSELGAEAVPALSKVVEFGSTRAARTALGALRAGGPAGVLALQKIADSHPDESVRMLARVALGRPIGHSHN